jgi:hypothetical protein
LSLLSTTEAEYIALSQSTHDLIPVLLQYLKTIKAVLSLPKFLECGLELITLPSNTITLVLRLRMEISPDPGLILSINLLIFFTKP